MISCTIIDSVELGEYEKKTIHMEISSKFIGYLRIVGIAGKVSSSLDKIPIWGKLNFDKIAIKLEPNQTKQDYDRKLEIQILPPISALTAKFTAVPKEVLAGEVFPISIELKNTGPNEIGDVYITTNSPRELILEPKTLIDMPLSIQKGKKMDLLDNLKLIDFPPDLRDTSLETFNKDREARRQYVTKILDTRDGKDQIKPGETRRMSAFIQAPHRKGRKSIKILIYYNVPENYPKIK